MKKQGYKFWNLFLILPIVMLIISAAYPAYAGESQDKALLEAVEKGDLAGINASLAEGADINTKRDYREDTPLMKAAIQGDSEIVKALLSKGAKVNERSIFGQTALMYAAIEGKEDVTKMLIESRADVNAKDERERTALIDASYNNYPAIVKMLISNGAQVNDEDISGKTAWVYAAERGYKEACEALLKAGAREKFDAMEWWMEYSNEKSPEEVIVKDALAWNILWRRLSREAPLDIDFKKYVVIGVFLGTRPTGGYYIDFGKPYLENKKMVIPYKEVKPEGFVTQALTQPYIIKVFEKKADEVLLRKEGI